MNITENKFVKRNLNLVDNNKFDANDIIWWDAENEGEYNEIERKINNSIIEKEKYSIYSWCDVSGYHYWVEQMEEPNYIQITVCFNTTEFTEEEEMQFIKDFESFYSDFDIYNIY